MRRNEESKSHIEEEEQGSLTEVEVVHIRLARIRSTDLPCAAAGRKEGLNRSLGDKIVGDKQF